MSTQTAPWIILFTPLISATLILLWGRFSKTLSASLAIFAALSRLHSELVAIQPVS
jgi:hypothetical protein